MLRKRCSGRMKRSSPSPSTVRRHRPVFLFYLDRARGSLTGSLSCTPGVLSIMRRAPAVPGRCVYTISVNRTRVATRCKVLRMLVRHGAVRWLRLLLLLLLLLVVVMVLAVIAIIISRELCERSMPRRLRIDIITRQSTSPRGRTMWSMRTRQGRGSRGGRRKSMANFIRHCCLIENRGGQIVWWRWRMV